MGWKDVDTWVMTLVTSTIFSLAISVIMLFKTYFALLSLALFTIAIAAFIKREDEACAISFISYIVVSAVEPVVILYQTTSPDNLIIAISQLCSLTIILFSAVNIAKINKDKEENV